MQTRLPSSRGALDAFIGEKEEGANAEHVDKKNILVNISGELNRAVNYFIN